MVDIDGNEKLFNAKLLDREKQKTEVKRVVQRLQDEYFFEKNVCIKVCVAFCKAIGVEKSIFEEKNSVRENIEVRWKIDNKKINYKEDVKENIEQKWIERENNNFIEQKKIKVESKRKNNGRIMLVSVIALIIIGIFCKNAFSYKNNSVTQNTKDWSDEIKDTENIDNAEDSTEERAVSHAYNGETKKVVDNDNYDSSLDEDLQNSENLYTENSKNAFYGIWTVASKDYSVVKSYADKFENQGWECFIFLTSEWENLNQEDWYAISIGIYRSKQEAQEYLESVKVDYPDAYIKYSGKYSGI